MAGLADYPHVLDIPTRWKDNDVYGHVNNVEYYSYFDTVINRWLITEGGLDIHAGAVIGLCVESHCAFRAAVSFPDTVRAGLRVAHLGRSSVRYEIGLFREDDPDPAAEGWFVHVFVDRAGRRPRDIPGSVRAALTFPETIEVGLRVGKLGRSSVRYELGIVRQGVDEATAEGHFVHVFVDRENRRPAPIPPQLRSSLERLQLPATEEVAP